MSQESENTPAFARPAFVGTGESGSPFPHHEQDGMTLRDYFAASALQGIISNEGISGEAPDQPVFINDAEAMAEAAYAVANAMLKARKS